MDNLGDGKCRLGKGGPEPPGLPRFRGQGAFAVQVGLNPLDRVINGMEMEVLGADKSRGNLGPSLRLIAGIVNTEQAFEQYRCFLSCRRATSVA